MSEVGATDRSRLLRLKKAELSGIVKSRKRKLREFFAVCDNGSTIPQLDISNPDTPPINPAEAHFLDITDILQDRLFDESNLPTRRQIRLESFENNTHQEKQSVASSQLKNASRRVNRPQCSETSPEKSQAIVHGLRNNVNVKTSLSKPLGKDFKIERPLLQGHEPKIPHAILAVDQKDGKKLTDSGSNSTVQLKKGIINIETSIVNETGITSTSKHDLIKASTIDVDHLPKTPQIQTSYVHKPQNNETSPLATSLLQKKPNQENGSINFPEKGIDNILQTGSSPSDQSIEKNSLIGKDQVNSITITPTTYHKSTNSSSYLEDCLDKNKTDPKENGNANLSKTETSQKEELELEANCQSNRNRINISGVVSESESNHVQDRETNGQSKASVVDVLDNHSDNLLTKESNDIVRFVVEKGQKLANNLRIKSSTSISQNGLNVAMRVKKKKNQKNSATDVEGQLPSDSNEVTNMANFEALHEKNKLIDAPIISSSLPSENSPMIKGTSKSTIDPKLQLIIPMVPSKPVIMHTSTERRNTRIGSGVLERKNVSEIFGDAILTSGSSSKSPSRFDLDSAKNSHLASQITNPQRPATRVRILTQKQKENENSKLSNVIFANKSVKVNSRISNDTNVQSESLKEDYFLPLFLANASTGKGYLPALENLLSTAHKTITTANAYVPIHENQTARILKRIYNLQSSHKWSLRQPKRSIEPTRPRSHRDILLQEALWMRTDFKEERKWKKSVAANIAYACAEWVSSSQEERKALQVKVTPLNHIAALDITQNSEDIDQAILSTSTLNESREAKLCLDDSEQPQLSLLETVAPTDIFGLIDNDVVFSMGRSHVVDKLLSELPVYGNPLQVFSPEQKLLDFDPDRIWKRPALPLSKYVEGKIRLKLNSPPRKKSRFEYDEEDDESQNEYSGVRTKKTPLPPESTEIALFDPKNRHILERIRNVNCFRPPSEFQMPSQSFFECRTASQWTWDEDKELKVLVRDYTYNWSLISSILTSKSKSDLATGAERRTPWECFERWIELEGLPGDMQKTYYFRLYTSRIENANKNNMALQSTQNLQGQMQQPRKKSTTSVRVERRRNQKHLVLIDTMRKLAKKREITIQKQQHAANMAAMRKVQEVPHITNRDLSATTPQYFSRLRHEHEFRKERTMQGQSRQDIQRRSVLAQRNPGLSTQHQSSLSNAIRPFPPGVSLGPNSSNLGNSNRAHQPSPPISSLPLSSSGTRIASIGLGFVPQAPMQGQISASSSSLDAGLVSRAHAISQHQQAILRQQQQQQQQQQNQVNGQLAHSSPRVTGVSSSNYSMQGNLIPPFSSNMNGVTTPSASSLSPLSQADSCRTTQPPQPFTPIQRMEIQFKTKYPSATPDQIANMISHAVSQSMQQQHQQRQNIAQNALNVAAGGPVASMNNMSKSQTTPQMYAQMLRQQQENRLL